MFGLARARPLCRHAAAWASTARSAQRVAALAPVAARASTRWPAAQTQLRCLADGPDATTYAGDVTTVEDMLTEALEGVPFVKPEDCPKLVEDTQTVFIDVREPPEWFETGIIKGALPMPRGVIEFVIEDKVDRNRTIVVYCRNGYRAALAGRTLQSLGYGYVMNGGGVDTLKEAGVPFEDVDTGAN